MTSPEKDTTISEDQSNPIFAGRRNVGAYDQPFSGVGMEFDPLSAPSADAEVTLHEVGYWSQNYCWNYPSVYSPFWRVYYDFESGHHVRFGKRSVSLGPEQFLVIPSHQRFDCVGDPPVPKFWIHFSCRWILGPTVEMPILVPVDGVLQAMVNEVPSMFEQEPTESRTRVRALSLAMLIYLLAKDDLPQRVHLPANIAAIIQRINEHPEYPWRNSELAAAASIRTESFIRKFKRLMNETPMRYVQQVRIRESCRLLTQSSLRIEEIALRLGFPDRFHFSRVFKTHTNQSPGAYRRRVVDAAQLQHSRRSEPLT